MCRLMIRCDRTRSPRDLLPAIDRLFELSADKIRSLDRSWHAAGAPVLVTFVVANPPTVTFPAGSAFQLTVTQTAPNVANRTTLVYPVGAAAGNFSRVVFNSATVIDVNSVQTFGAAYPGGAAQANFNYGSTVYVRLWSYLSGGWQYTDYTYKAAGSPRAVMQSPTPGSTTSSSASRTANPAAATAILFAPWALLLLPGPLASTGTIMPSRIRATAMAPNWIARRGLLRARVGVFFTDITLGRPGAERRYLRTTVHGRGSVGPCRGFLAKRARFLVGSPAAGRVARGFDATLGAAGSGAVFDAARGGAARPTGPCTPCPSRRDEAALGAPRPGPARPQAATVARRWAGMFK